MVLTWDQTFFIGIGILSSTLFLSTLVVGKFIWEPLRKRFDNEVLPPLPYKVRYPLDENDASSNDLELMIHNVIVENTPDGTVFMRYNADQEGFEYWSENTIDFAYLDTVARKYVLIYKCKNAYTEMEEVIIEEEKEDPSKNKIDEDLFVCLNKRKKKKNRKIMKSNKFIHKGKCKDAPFFDKEKVENQQFFCGANIQGLDYNSFKNAIFKRKFT